MEKYIDQLIEGDCLKVVAELPDNSIDLIIVDPPYGDGREYGRFDKEILNNEDETINYRVLPILHQKLKDGGVTYLFTNWKFSWRIQQYIASQGMFNIRMQIVIVKNNFGMGYGFRNQYELCLVLEKGKATYNSHGFSNVIHMEHIAHDPSTHPHQKGLEMLKQIIDHSSKEGDIVLDCFAGSGSTLVAAKEMKRRYIGIELDKKWIEHARERLLSTTNQLF